MVKEIYLATGLYDNKILTLADNENITFKIVGRTYPNLTYYFKAKNGGKFYNLKFVNNSVEFDRKNLVYGKFEAKVVAMANENIIREFGIEDLLLRELGTEIKCVPEMEELRSQVNKITEENEQMKRKIEELQDLCEKTTELVVKLNGLTEKVGA